MQLAIGGVDSDGSDSSVDLLASGRRRTRGQTAQALAGVAAVAGVIAALALPTTAADGRNRAVVQDFTTTAVSQDLAATVLTLEPGVVGIQNFYHFTPKTLQGSYCAAPNTCQAVDYLTLPGDGYNEKGADTLLEAVKNLPADGGPVTLMGYSQGAQVIYSALRRWQAKPSTAPDPSRVSWVSIGNPDNPIGGVRNSLGTAQPRPAQTPYAGTEVIRQYDGWADWPDDPSNLLAVFNAVVGMTTVHSNYFDVDINHPANVRYTPDLADGTPGNVTYVWVPNPVLPMIAGFGPLAPTLDSWLRPTVEAGYNRPVPIPGPGAKSAAATAAATAVPTTSSVLSKETSPHHDSRNRGHAAARAASSPRPASSVNHRSTRTPRSSTSPQ